MQKHHYKTIMFFIIATILVTLGIQGYWNYKNYLVDKQQFINEVQIGLDNAVDTYYADLAEENILGISLSDEARHMNHYQLDSVFNKIDGAFVSHPEEQDSLRIEAIQSEDMKSINIFSGVTNSKVDTLFRKLYVDQNVTQSIAKWNSQDSLDLNPFVSLTTKVIFAISNDSLKLPELNKLVARELRRKNIIASYSLIYTPSTGDSQISQTGSVSKNALRTFATSSYLPRDSTIELAFSNTTITILKRNSIGLLLSLLFVIAIITCLLYLLKIINRQKQLAEVKNDLISNITHEFKTPLATIGAAMEGIQIFNKSNDPDKTMKYATVSATQVEKLNGMVEKLLETATLDSEQLQLNLEEIDLVHLLDTIAARERLNVIEKHISFATKEPIMLHAVDKFHFENALNNIVDNALKYGGDEIIVSLTKTKDAIRIGIQDNGRLLTTSQGKQIFDKFYRVPKGNTHDVKGFGIGLYYTKVIIEKHGGTIGVQVQPTVFNIDLPL